MVRLFLYIVVIFVSANSFGQVLNFTDLKKMPPVINSQGEESMPLLSPDQTKLFFIRSVYEGNMGGRYGGQDIWCSERTQTGWKNPTNKLNFLNDKDNNVLVGLNADGRTVYTLNSSPSVKLEGLYFTQFNDKKNAWSKPEFVPLPGIENQDFVGMFVSPDYDVIFMTMKAGDTRGEEDIYFSVKASDGSWSRPKNIGATINSAGYEISPFLSQDKKRLFFASNGHGGYGDADIFYCERLYDSWETWSAPVNLGPLVNSKKFDAYFSIYGDSTAFFTSNRDNQLSDIFTVKVSIDKNILADGKKYLTDKEWNSLVGKNVVREIIFKDQTKVLTASQKELLYYLANKLTDQRDVGIHLLVKSQENDELTHSRLREIYGELRLAGIDSDRIREDKTQEIKTSNQGIIEIQLFK